MNCTKRILLFMVVVYCFCCQRKVCSFTHQKNFTVALKRRDLPPIHSPAKTTLEYSVRRNIAQQNQLEALLYVSRNEYIVQLGLGTPPVSFPAMIDTGSDLIWAPCNAKSCNGNCGQVYSPSQSSTPTRVSCQNELCKALPSSCSDGCKYHYSYGYGNSSSNGILLSETFTFATISNTKVPVTNIAFGCSYDIQGIPQGLGFVGLGRGPLSLVSQLGPKINHKFSYCLVSNNGASASKTSHLIFGDVDDSIASQMKSTPLVENPFKKSVPYYYLGLDGISVGGQLLGIPRRALEFKSDGSGGLVIDSGSQLTYLESGVYYTLKKALQSAISLPQADGSNLGLDLCYDLSSAGNSGNLQYPDITFHFQRGADFVVPKENYLVEANSNVVCLTMVPSKLGFSIVGSIQQQNFHILYDNSKMTVSFAPANCAAM